MEQRITVNGAMEGGEKKNSHFFEASLMACGHWAPWTAFFFNRGTGQSVVGKGSWMRCMSSGKQSDLDQDGLMRCSDERENLPTKCGRRLISLMESRKYMQSPVSARPFYAPNG